MRRAVGHRELAPGTLGLEQLDRGPRLPLGGSAIGGEPRQARQPPAVVALAHAVTALLVERERRPAGLDGFFELLAQVTLVRPALPQLRSAVGVECGAMAERAPELLGGLAVDAQPGGPFPASGAWRSTASTSPAASA